LVQCGDFVDESRDRLARRKGSMAELNPEQWTGVERPFTAAGELQPEERSDLPSARIPDPDLRREVASLLDYSGDGLESAGAEIRAAAAALTQRTRSRIATLHHPRPKTFQKQQ
jgi:hypothetical protein